MDREGLRQPLSGWLGHAAPFEFAPSYRPAQGIGRFVCGTPPILAMRALECGLEVFGEAEAFGGMAALRAKSIALTELFIERVEAACAGLGLTLASPRAGAERGSQVSFAHADGYPVMQALIERGSSATSVPARRAATATCSASASPRSIPASSTPGTPPRCSPRCSASEAWREPRFAQRAAVT
jgi:kynureninase